MEDTRIGTVTQQDTAVREVPLSRRSVIIVTVIVAAILLGMFYSVEQRYGITWPNFGWMLVLAALMFATSYVQYRDKPVARETGTPGLLMLKALTMGMVVFFLISRSPESFDVVMAEVWPLLLGAVLGLFAGMLNLSLFRH